MIMINQFKLVGGFRKQYKRTPSIFQKRHYRPEEFYWELKGYKIAEDNNVSVPKILKINKEKLIIYFENIKAFRLDQIIIKNPSKIFRITKKTAHLIAYLHKKTKNNHLPLFQLAEARMIKMQKELTEFGNIPNYLSSNIQKIIKKEIKKIRKISKTSFIHGDFTLQNLFLSKNKIIIFDWENSCFSDPLYDIGIFLSFLGVIAIKFGKFSPNEIKKIEQVFLKSYCKINYSQIIDVERIHFYQIFSCHTTYWFYLYLFDQLRKQYNVPLLEKYLAGQKCSLLSLYEELAKRFKIKPKYTSFIKMHNFLAKNSRIDQLPFCRKLELKIKEFSF